MELFNILLKVIENPNLKKYYVDLEKYYRLYNRIEEANAIQHLIEKRFQSNYPSDNQSRNT